MFLDMILGPFWMTSFAENRGYLKWPIGKGNLQELRVTVSTMPVGGLALFDARASAGTMVTKIGKHIYTGQAPENCYRYVY